MEMRRQHGIVLSVLIVLIIGLFVYLVWWYNNKESFTTSNTGDSPVYPEIIAPLPAPDKICTKPDGSKVKCGYDSRDLTKLRDNKERPGEPSFLPELKLCNNSPLKLDIYHRPAESNGFIFVATIPSMETMYAYEDQKKNTFNRGAELFATQHGDTKIIYLSVPLVAGKNIITWGTSSSEIDESRAVVNLLGEIDHIKFRNYSLVPYRIYYYGEFLGKLEPYVKDKDIYFEFYATRSQGYRLGSKITLQMEGVKGEVPSQGIVLSQRALTTLNVGLVDMDCGN